MEKFHFVKRHMSCLVFICMFWGLPSCSHFLCCDWLWLAAGSESGRSSPYYGQEGRSSTPTTNQPPKHFHVPGRTPHRLIALTFSLLHTEDFTSHYSLMQIIQKAPFAVTWERGRISVQHITVLPQSTTYTLLYDHHHPPCLQHITPSLPLLLHVSRLHLLFLSSATGDPNIYRKPPIYKRTGTVQLAPP